MLEKSQPLCHACKTGRWQTAAETAGLTFLHRDPADRHYGFFRAPCGHEVRRQFDRVALIADGMTDLRCETCHAARDAAEAAARGWRLRGPDPGGNPNYRLFEHVNCGHSQRIARANMQSGRFGCGGCGTAWPASPSAIYLMRFTLSDGMTAVKLGYSRDVDSRLHHQLRLRADLPAAILRRVAMPTGQAAIRAEKALHADIQRRFPSAALPRDRFDDVIRVKTEVYDGALEATLLALLDDLAAGVTPPGSRAA